MRASSKSLIILALLHLFCAQNTFESDFQLETQELSAHDQFYNGVKFHIGSGNEKTPESAFLLIDIAHPYSIIGDKTKYNWGINCKDATENSCSVVDPTENEDFFNFFYYKWVAATAYGRFNSEYKLKTEGIPKMNFRLATAGQKWYLGSYGVLGLSPQSDFATYARTIAFKDLSLGIKFKLLNPTADNNGLHYEGYIIQNPTVDQKDLLLSVDYKSSDKAWTLKGSLALPGTEYNFKDQSFCLTTTQNEIIQVIDAMDFCHRVQEIACGGQIMDQCNKTSAKLEKLPNLTLTFNEGVFAFTPQEYTFFTSKGYLECRVGDIGGMRSDSQCGKYAELGVGKMFFAKFIPVFSYSKTGGARLDIVKDLKVVEKKGNSIWIILAIVGAIIAIAIILYIILQKRQAKEDKYENVA